jgi:hypothetical protein
VHRFLRAIGFSKIKTREEFNNLIKKALENPVASYYNLYKDDVVYGDKYFKVGNNMGLVVCGDIDSNDEFVWEYAFPCFEPSMISTNSKSSVDRQASRVAFSGICEDNKIGVTIIYYLINRIDYMKESLSKNDSLNGISVSFSALSDKGTIMMPLAKDVLAKQKGGKKKKNRDKLIEAARQGDEKAIESLTIDDIDVYSTLSRRIKEDDLYTIVDTYFMPYGVECDLYSVMGEIEEFTEVKNTVTGEMVYQMSISCNGMHIDVCINKEDLFGEPAVGRRFKGTIWLQGQLNYPLK